MEGSHQPLSVNCYYDNAFFQVLSNNILFSVSVLICLSICNQFTVFYSLSESAKSAELKLTLVLKLNQWSKSVRFLLFPILCGKKIPPFPSIKSFLPRGAVNGSSQQTDKLWCSLGNNLLSCFQVFNL